MPGLISIVRELNSLPLYEDIFGFIAANICIYGMFFLFTKYSHSYCLIFLVKKDRYLFSYLFSRCLLVFLFALIYSFHELGFYLVQLIESLPNMQETWVCSPVSHEVVVVINSCNHSTQGVEAGRQKFKAFFNYIVSWRSVWDT